jgi:hypothetical protein
MAWIAHGAVVDVEFILGERSAPKVSERLPEGMPAPERVHSEGQHKRALPE